MDSGAGKQHPPLLGAMDAARGKTLADFSEQINSMVWSARLWLRGIALPQSQKYIDEVLLTEDARAEITRRAMEAEQTADRQEVEQ